jgi:type I restriction enzyme S subunit
MVINAYPNMKNSGVEWIGEIPEHWDVTKVKWSTYVKGRVGWKGLTSDEYKLEGPYLVTGTDFKDGEINWNNAHHVERERYLEDEFIILKDDDVLITKDGTIGKVAHIRDFDMEATLNSGIFVTRPLHDEYLPRYFYWVLKSKPFKLYVDLTSHGSTIAHLYQNVFVDFKFQLPDILEQTRIVAFLDDKTSKIDELIAKKERKIELLKEQRKALINQAVTKGLDPTVPMKDSGVEWIGDIPEGWEIKRLKFIAQKMISGPFGSSLKKEFYTKSGYKIYGQEQVIKDNFEFGDYYISEKKFKELQRCEVFSGDILISCVGTFGKITMVPENFERGIINPRLLKVEPNINLINSEFLLSVLRSDFIFKQFESHSRGGTMGVINLEILSRLILTIPPLHEQAQILEYLKSQTKVIDDSIAQESKKIELLKEYRQALISEVVTGKVDVRDWEPKNKEVAA